MNSYYIHHSFSTLSNATDQTKLPIYNILSLYFILSFYPFLKLRLRRKRQEKEEKRRRDLKAIKIRTHQHQTTVTFD
jgi:hypothetical protein